MQNEPEVRTKDYLFVSDFDQNPEFQRFRNRIERVIGAAGFGEKIRGLSRIHLVQDYDRNHDHYKPDVLASRLIRRDGNDFKVYMRLMNGK
jgi:hypothetical protein